MKHNIFTLAITCLVLCIVLFSCKENEPSDFTIEWTCVTESAPWAPRYGHTSVVKNNKIWIIGGYGNGFKSDVWYSSDGMNWICATESADWFGKSFHSSVVYENKLWVLAGYFSRTPSSDAWFSWNGMNWYCTNDSAEYGRRVYQTSLVFKNKIWLLGGSQTHEIRDIWYSTNGINWVCAVDSADWSPRSCHTSVVFSDKIWLLGGYFNGNDVWYSADGISWVCATDSAAWSGKYGHTAVVIDNKIWVMGGVEINSSWFRLRNDVWFSTNGRDWDCLIDSAPWDKRLDFSSVVFDNKIWILGGDNKNDVWYGEIVHGKR